MSRACLVLLLSVLPAASARAAQVPFDASVPIGTESAGIDAAVRGDFDADGDEDIVYASRGGARVSWSRNERGSFAPRVTLFPRENVNRLVAADFDQDGRVDLVSATSGGVLAWHRALAPSGGGQAQFDTRPAFATAASGITRLATGDLNQDGRPDLVIGREETPVLQSFLATGDAGSGFAAAVNVPVPNGVARIAGLAVEDVDLDGLADILATGNSDSTQNTLLAQLFAVPRATPAAFGTPEVVESRTSSTFLVITFGNLAVGEFDRLNGPDVMFVQGSSLGPGDLVLRRHQGGTFDTPGGVYVDGSLGRSEVLSNGERVDTLQAADIDRDGDTDVAFNAGPGRDGNWLENRGLEPFLLHPIGATVQGGNAIATFVVDDDVDGDPDLIVANESGTVRRLHNRRIHGRVEVRTSVGLRNVAGGVAIDGPFDVITRRRGRSSEREVVFTEFIGGRVQAFRTTLQEGSGSPVFTFHPPPLAGNLGAARELARVDVGFDGDDDLLIATGVSAASTAGNQNRLTFSINQGIGVAATNTTLGCVQGNDLRGVDVGRFGTLGLKAVYAADANNRVALATCPAETTISTAANGVPNAPGVAKLGDLDQDGDLDLLIAARLPSAPPLVGDVVGWYPNTGNGVFGALQVIGAVTGADEATLLDFDRDGRLDVATASNGDPGVDPGAGRVLLFRNLGGGAFAERIVAATGFREPGRIAGGDVDHDGDIDLVLPSDSPLASELPRTQCGIALLEAQGDGSFAAPRCLDLAPRGRFTRLALDDLTRDGTLDVAATSLAANLVGVVVLAPPAPFTAMHGFLTFDVALSDGEERCFASYSVQSNARPADSAMALAHYAFEATAPDLDGVIAAMVLRVDDGDLVPDPARDVEVARTLAASDGQYTLAPPPEAATLVPGSPRRTFFACLQAAPRVPATRQEFSLRRPDAALVDLGSGVVLEGGAESSGLSGLRVRSARIFRDGVEGF